MIGTIASPFQSSLTTSVCCTFKVFVLLIFLNRCRCGCPELASSVTPQKKCLICSNYAWKTDALMENARWNRFPRVPIQTQFLVTRRARRRLRCRQRKCQNTIKTTPLQVQLTFFVHFFALSTRLPCENPWSDVLWRTMNFSFSYKTWVQSPRIQFEYGVWSWGIQLQKVRLHLTKW